MLTAEAQLEVLEVVRLVHTAEGRAEAAEGRLLDLYAHHGVDGLVEVAAAANVLLWQSFAIYLACPEVPMSDVLGGFARMFRNELEDS